VEAWQDSTSDADQPVPDSAEPEVANEEAGIESSCQKRPKSTKFKDFFSAGLAQDQIPGLNMEGTAATEQAGNEADLDNELSSSPTVRHSCFH
jgi:hypothetical protein